MNLLKILAAFAVAAVVVACGGGGGGGSPTPTPVGDTTPPVLTLATTSPALTTTTIVVTSNEDLGGNVAITVKNGGATISGSTTLNAGNRGMTWTNTSGTALACNTVYAVSASGTDLAGNSSTIAGTVTTAACQAGLTYDHALVAARFGIPGMINLATSGVWSEATNSTSYQSGSHPFISTYLAEAPLADCSYLELVHVAADGQLHVVNHNLVTNTLMNFTGQLPAGYEFTANGSSIGPKWHNLPWGAPPFPYMLAWGQEASGNYAYTDAADNRVLRKASSTGAQLGTVYTSPDGGSFTVINSVSCTAH